MALLRAGHQGDSPVLLQREIWRKGQLQTSRVPRLPALENTTRLVVRPHPAALGADNVSDKSTPLYARLIVALLIGPLVAWLAWSEVAVDAFGAPRLNFWQVLLAVCVLRSLTTKIDKS